MRGYTELSSEICARHQQTLAITFHEKLGIQLNTNSTILTQLLLSHGVLFRNIMAGIQLTAGRTESTAILIMFH